MALSLIDAMLGRLVAPAPGLRVRCAVCEGPVEKWESWQENDTGDVVIRVHCHGETEEMRVLAAQMTSDMVRTLNGQIGVAFVEQARNLCGCAFSGNQADCPTCPPLPAPPPKLLPPPGVEP